MCPRTLNGVGNVRLAICCCGMGLYPVQTTVAVLSQAPCVVERDLIEPRPPNITIMPEAVPACAADACAMIDSGGGDCYGGMLTFYHVAVPNMSIFQISPTASDPVLPP